MLCRTRVRKQCLRVLLYNLLYYKFIFSVDTFLTYTKHTLRKKFLVDPTTLNFKKQIRKVLHVIFANQL